VIIVIHLAVVALLISGDAGAVATGGLLLAAVGLAGLAALFVGRGRVVRGLLAALVGLSATVAGLATSVPHSVVTGLGGTDPTGILATVAGIALVVLAFWLALHGRRLLVKLALAIPACIVIAQWLIAPAIIAGIATHGPRPSIASASTLGFPGARDVTFPARDGTRLSGWYVPGRSGRAVILLHGSHGTRADTVAQLRMLAADGYGVLAFDARGHGLSSGETNAFGWRGTDDIAGAMSFLAHQPGIDSHRIAALGLSMGAEEALRAAASGIPLRAVVADGAGASTLGDQQIVTHGLAPVFVSETWLTMRAIELVSGEAEPPSLNTTVGHIHVPVLLIASGASNERAIDDVYRQRIGSNAALWYLPDATHTRGLATHPQAYAARVNAFLNAALAQR
jgi:pimeloyl-ACP methyl ester carboxylesterase